MKKFIILALICLNLALVATVTFHVPAEKTYAQRVRRGSGEYMLATGRRRSKDDVLYVIEGRSKLLFAFWPDTTRGGELKLVTMGPRYLERDFPVTSR